MNTRPPRSTRKDTLFPDTTRFRSLPRHTGSVEDGGHGGPGVAVLGQRRGEGEDKPQPLRLLHLVAAQLVAAPRERCEVARAHATVLVVPNRCCSRASEQDLEEELFLYCTVRPGAERKGD